ncbi:hypothetical protein PINS_up005893 [Pythium insidiosum]|nr:hypothetical protein PINS_up005893 [Pythium insidiosum]
MAPDHHNNKANCGDSDTTISAINDSMLDITVDKPEQGYVGLEDSPLADLEMPRRRFVVRHTFMRECMAEFFGNFVMACIGLGVNNEVLLSNETKGTWMSINVCWGIAVMLGVHCAEGVSGSHLNSAVTLAMATFKGFPWRKVPGYIVAQLLGCFMATIVVYIMYYEKLNQVDPDRKTTQGNFVTFPSEDVGNLTALYTEFVATAMFVIGLFCIMDKRNRPASNSARPLHFMLLLWAIGMAFGFNTGYAINPTRDLAPRVFIAMAGWGSKVFTIRDYYFWIPIVGPSLGGIFGGALYEAFVGNHHP